MGSEEPNDSREGRSRYEKGDVRLRGQGDYLISIIAISWALFQLSLASVLIIDTTTKRTIHLAFALALLFLLNPRLNKPSKSFVLLSVADRIPTFNYVLIGLSVFSALYLTLDYQGIAMRIGIPITRDIIIGVILVVLLLEATRRAIGPALPLIAILFTAYAFLGPHMPEALAFKGVSLARYLSNITLSTEGIYGIPLGVSASIVYLFVLMGGLLHKAEAGRFFTNLALSVLGPLKGGAAKAAVVASGATGLVSGSSIANIVTTGPFTIPLMKKTGYPPEKAAAIEVAASTDGQLLPPIMGAAAFIIAEYVNVPYLEVVKAAAIPAVVSYFGLFCITHLEASKLDIKGLSSQDTPDFFPTLKSGAHFLFPLAVLVYELVILRRTPESAAFKAIMVLLLAILYQEVRKSLQKGNGIQTAISNTFRIIVQGFVQGSRNMISVAIACASAGIVVGVVNMGIGGMISSGVEILSQGNLFLLLLFTATASLLLGMGLPTTATYIVMASLTAPIIVKVGGLFGFIIPIMAAHLFCFYFGILADDTPPVGLAAYAASAIAESEPIRTGIQGFLYDIRTSCIAFMFVFNPELILHGISSWTLALLIFGMALVGISAFECFAMGYCITRNRWFEIPFFLSAAFILFHPGAIAAVFNVDPSRKYYFYFLGLIIYGIVALMQVYANLERRVRERTLELSTALERQTLISETLRTISQLSHDAKPVLSAIVENAARLCGAGMGFIFTLDRGLYHLQVDYGSSAEFGKFLRENPIRPGRETVIGRAAVERHPVHSQDVVADPECGWTEAQQFASIRSMLGIPMLRDGVPIGIMALARKEVQPFKVDQIELMGTFADQAVIAIENVRLFRELEARSQDLARSVQELQGLREVSQAISSSLDLQTVLSRLVANAVEFSGTDAGAIYEFDEQTQEFRLGTTYKMGSDLIRTIQKSRIQFGQTILGQTGETRKPVQIPDILGEPTYPLREAVAQAGFRALLAVPLLGKDRLVGALVVRRKRPGEFSEETVNFLENLASQSVMAIQNAQLFREIEEKGKELEIASQHKSQFLANMSHELRTPLNAILGFTELILDKIYGEVPAKIQEVLERVEKNGRHLLSLINDVLDLSKIEAGRLSLSISEYSMKEIVQTVLMSVEPLAAEKNIALSFSVPEGLMSGKGDQQRISQVFLNLIGNAIKFTEKGNVKVEVGVSDDSFLVTVSDTGPGLSQADQERIFEEFQQGDSSNTKKKGGTGLGLSISKRIVEMHGGDIWVESTPGAGSTFYFRLPIRLEHQRA